MDTYRWAEGVSVTTAKAFKKGLLFFLLFSFVSSFRRRARLSGRKNFIGYKQMGFGLFAKDGVYWIWGGLGAKYRTYKMWHRLWGWVCFFFLSFRFFFSLFQNRLRWDFLGFAGPTGCSFRQDTQHYFRHSRAHKGHPRRGTKQKKRWYQKIGLGATGEFFYTKGYGFFCCFSYESFFLFLFVWVSLGWSGIDFYILVTFFLLFSYRLLCVYALPPSCLYLWCKVCLGSSHVFCLLIYCQFSPQILLPPLFLLRISFVVCCLPLIAPRLSSSCSSYGT